MDDANVTTEQAISWLEKRLEQRPTPGERVVFSMALSALRTQQEKKPDGWISVKDRLPTDGRQVLTFVGYEDTFVGFMTIGCYFCFGAQPHWQWDGLLRDGQRTLFWMPLQEPPEDETA